MNRCNAHARALAAVVLLCFAGFPGLANAGVTPWIDIDVVGGHLVINSVVSGIPGRSIVDTGAVGTAINSNFVKANNLSFQVGRTVNVAGVVATEERPSYRKVETVLFDTPLTFSNVVDINLGSPQVQLLVGADFLTGYVIQFDYPNEKMRLISRDSIDLKRIRNIKSKRHPDNGSILVRMALNDKKKSWLLLDTGASAGLVVSRNLAYRMDWVGTYDTESSRIGGVISTSLMESFRVPTVQIGPFTIENALVSMPVEGEKLEMFAREKAFGSRLKKRNPADGILGYDILKHFVVTVDYGKGYVHLSPGQQDESG